MMDRYVGPPRKWADKEVRIAVANLIGDVREPDVVAFGAEEADGDRGADRAKRRSDWRVVIRTLGRHNVPHSPYQMVARKFLCLSSKLSHTHKKQQSEP